MATPLWINQGGVLRRRFLKDQDIDPNAKIQATKIAGIYKLIWDSQDSGVVYPTASITTPTLPQNYSSLHVVWQARADGAATSENMLLRMNGDSTAGHYNYEFQREVGTGSSSGESLNNNTIYVGDMSAANAEGNAVGSGTIWIPGYSQNGVRQMAICTAGTVVGGNSGFTGFMAVTQTAGRWSSAVAITTLTFFTGGGNFISPFTRISVFGVDG